MRAWVLFASLLLVTLAGCAGTPRGPANDSTIEPVADEPAEAYQAVPLDGGAPGLPDGDVVLLTVWASWCSICKGDEPIWDALQADYGAQDFTVFAVSREAREADAQAYHDGTDFSYRMLWDKDVNRFWGMRDYQPNHVLIDRDGEVVFAYEGSLRARSGGEEQLRQDIEALL